jgi:hypothetical protein
MELNRSVCMYVFPVAMHQPHSGAAVEELRLCAVLLFLLPIYSTSLGFAQPLRLLKQEIIITVAILNSKDSCYHGALIQGPAAFHPKGYWDSTAYSSH